MQPTTTHCDFHLGDNLAALHFLRRAAMRHPDRIFMHLTHACHHGNLAQAVEDIPNLNLGDIEKVALPERGTNLWKNAGGFWQNHRDKDDWCVFHADWHRHLSETLDADLQPLAHPDQLRLNYHALAAPRGFALNFPPRFDFLIVNSRPCSGQFMAYDSTEYLDELIAALAARHSVIVTQKTDVPGVRCTDPLTVTGIGSIAMNAANLIMVSTGPSWTAMNLWNTPEERAKRLGAPGECILLIGRERVNFAGVTHCGRREEVMEIARTKGWI